MTITITDELLSDLETKARAATPGPWLNLLDDIATYDFIYVAQKPKNEHQHICGPNADYIAAASPDVVLALVEEVRTLNVMIEWFANGYSFLAESRGLCALDMYDRCTKPSCFPCVVNAARIVVEAKINKEPKP